MGPKKLLDEHFHQTLGLRVQRGKGWSLLLYRPFFSSVSVMERSGKMKDQDEDKRTFF